MTKLTCLTWNVHRARGRDGRVDPGRVEATLAALAADIGPQVIALQEADQEQRPHARIFDRARIARETGLVWAHEAPHLRWGAQSDGFLGTILFLHPEMRTDHADVIDLPGHCHRGAVAVEATWRGTRCRIVSTHLSLSQPLRIVQMRTLGQYLRRRPAMQTILLGDFNEWRPWGGLAFHPRLVGRAFRGPARASFPAAWPFLPLDRILTDAPGKVSAVTIHHEGAVRAASDHLALSGLVTLG